MKSTKTKARASGQGTRQTPEADAAQGSAQGSAQGAAQGSAQGSGGAPGAETEALGEIMLVQSTMQRQFLRAMLRRVATDVPDFNAELFLAELQILRDSLSNPQDSGQPSAIRNFALKEWERLCDMAVDTIAATRARPPETH